MPYIDAVGESKHPQGQKVLCLIADRSENLNRDGWVKAEVSLRAEPDNPFDRNAVAVMVKHPDTGKWVKTGYLPKSRKSTPQGQVSGLIRRHPDYPDNPGLRVTWQGQSRPSSVPQATGRGGCSVLVFTCLVAVASLVALLIAL